MYTRIASLLILASAAPFAQAAGLPSGAYTSHEYTLTFADHGKLTLLEKDKNVLDGTWSKAKTLWWRNPWLNKQNRMSLKPARPSIYGRLRAEPRTDYVSTLESVAAALTLCGEDKEIEVGLLRVFRTLVQRVRDADIPPEGRRLARASRALKDQ